MRFHRGQGQPVFPHRFHVFERLTQRGGLASALGTELMTQLALLLHGIDPGFLCGDARRDAVAFRPGAGKFPDRRRLNQ